MMRTFFCKWVTDRVLIGPSELLSKLSFLKADVWRIRDIEFVHSGFQGMNALELEERSRSNDQDLLIRNEDFQDFLQGVHQIIDGFIDGYRLNDNRPYFTLDCFDTSFWEISTEDAELAQQLREAGLKEVSQ